MPLYRRALSGRACRGGPDQYLCAHGAVLLQSDRRIRSSAGAHGHHRHFHFRGLPRHRGIPTHARIDCYGRHRRGYLDAALLPIRGRLSGRFPQLRGSGLRPAAFPDAGARQPRRRRGAAADLDQRSECLLLRPGAPGRDGHL